MAQQPDAAERMMTLIERLVGALIEIRLPDDSKKKNRNAMDAEGAHDGHDNSGPGYPRPYVG